MHSGTVLHLLVTCALFWRLGLSQIGSVGGAASMLREQGRVRLRVQATGTGQNRDKAPVPGKTYGLLRVPGVLVHSSATHNSQGGLHPWPKHPLGGNVRLLQKSKAPTTAQQPSTIMGVSPLANPSVSVEKAGLSLPDPLRQESSPNQPQERKTPRQAPRAKVASQRPRLIGPNVCGGQCCSGWMTALGTGRCIKPVCNPPCQNKGSCSRPQTCVCRSGFQGSRCEHVVPEQEYQPRSSKPQASAVGSAPRASRHRNSSTPTGEASARAAPQPGPLSGPQRMPALPVTPQQHSGSSRTVRRYPSVGSQLTSNALPNGHQQGQTGSSLPSIAHPGSARSPWGMNLTEKIGRIKIVFTPTICKQTCSQGHCFNYCEKGATTTLYSQSGHNSDPKTGFRIYFCQIPCLNGGRCVGRDECWCPSNSTGKFCHLPAPKLDRKEAGLAETGANPKVTLKQTMITLPLSNQLGPFSPSLVNVHINHPPEANVQIHQVARVRSDQSTGENSVEGAVESPESPHWPGHGTSNGRWNENSIAGSSEPHQGGQDTLGTCFLANIAGKCGHPLPGLTRQDDCCGSVGVSWGVNRCTLCPSKRDHPVINNSPVECPRGYKRLNLTHCQDINECLMAGLCKNAECLNTRGSYRCSCLPEYMLDTSQRRCVSDKALSMEQGPCFRSLGRSTCSLPLSRRISKQLCCCSRVGKAWGRRCEKCPLPGTDIFKEICPAGHGYTYSRDDIQLSMREAEEEEAFLTSEEQGAAGPSTPSWVPVRQQLQESYSSVTESPKLEDAKETSENRMVSPTPSLPVRRIPEPKPPVNADIQTTGIDICAVLPSLCGAGTCVKRPDGYTCLCNPGFRLNTEHSRCIDINECDSTTACQGGRCVNTPGSYRCQCEWGYTKTREGHCEDIDECHHPSACPEEACINTPGSYECLRCPEGFRPSIGKCQDEDECANRSLCRHGQCLNVDGSYQCSCSNGYEASVDGKSCKDFDECSLPSVCPSGVCTNTLGSFSCLTCEDGYRISADRLMCRDIDECAVTASSCHGGHCINTPGSYTCLCTSGFELENGTHCEDVNECLRADICGPNGDCLNSNGSYFCLCAPGYSNAAGGVSCEDVDECADESSCSGGQCLNMEGSYRCVCESGFRHSEETHHCVDVDECSDYGDRICGSWKCQNTQGSYRCIMGCQPGFQMAADADGDCADIDECVNGTLCGSQSFCENTEGSYRCLCDRGYELSPRGIGCVDINECELMVAVCGTALCENVEGSFLCLCISDHEEYHPESGHCQRRMGSVVPEVSAIEQPTSPEKKECYYNINHQQLCENVLARNITKAECCCTEGSSWGDNCETQPCPIQGTVEFNEICPSGKGYIPVEGTFHFGQRSYTDADECAMFSSEICSKGLCINMVPGYTCFCQSGFYYDSVKLECVDHDECGSLTACENGECVNTQGAYHCFCSPPLVLDVTHKRCINTTAPPEEREDLDMLDMHTDICWQRVETNFICSEPLQGRRTTYTECCCLYGEAWSQQCALCPPPASVEFAELCNLHRGGSGPERNLGLRERTVYEYETDLEDSNFGLYGPDVGVNPYYNDVGPEYSAPDTTFGVREQGTDFGSSGIVRIPQIRPPELKPQEHGSQRGRYAGFEGLRAEECGILNGCENGRCVRVREGYTCDCFDGFELELTKLACIDINECESISNGTALCQNGQCENTDGSYRCVCLPGYVASQEPHRCVPHTPEGTPAGKH
ncbi:latent-transforming growth factor beta-binding protein 2 isoform X3 [Ambystoma mexicanum]|uniref:latent-transforming growth factor beta-binding protein 2 isoform X3 n=1 Tax=Ambystoma mexicanum TaxID=8296 RepID=UPI0037E8C6AE